VVRLLIIATLLAAVVFALWVMWRGTAATDPFAGIDNAGLRAQAQQAAAGVQRRPPQADLTPPLPPLEAPVQNPVPVATGPTDVHVDEARLREQTRARAMDEAKQRTTVTAPDGPAVKPWFIPVARPDEPLLDGTSSPVDTTDATERRSTPSPRRSAAPAWQRR